MVVIACGAGGAIYALNASSDSTLSKATANYELKKEQAKPNGWNQKDSAWYYYKDDKVQTGWIQDNDKWYYMNNDGTMAVNTTIDGCYLNQDGIIAETPAKKKESDSEVKF